MKTLAKFLPFVMPFARSCPQEVAEQAILDAAIDFCEQTGVLQRTLDPLDVGAGVMEYELLLPTKQELVQVKRAWFKGSELTPVAVEAVGIPQAWRDDVPGVTPQAGDPQAFYSSSRNSIAVYPRPRIAEEGVLTVRAATKPSRSATQLEDELFEDWVEAIAAGALMRLHAAPGTAYTDTTRSETRRTEFQVAVNKAKYRANFGRTRGELAVTMRPFA